MHKFWALFKLNLRIFIGQPIGSIIGIVAPTLMILIVPYLFNGIANIQQTVPLKITLGQMVPGLLLMPTIFIGLIGIPITLSTMKGTNLLKKIRMTNVSSFTFIATFIFTFLLIIIVLTLGMFTLSKALWQVDSPNPAGGAFLIPWLLMVVCTIGLGLIIGNISNNAMTSFAIGLAMMLPIMFLAGVFFAEMNGWVQYAAKIIPQNHLTQMFKSSWFTNVPIVENYHTGPFPNILIKINLMGIVPDTITAYVYPICLFSIQTIILTKTFKWE